MLEVTVLHCGSVPILFPLHRHARRARAFGGLSRGEPQLLVERRFCKADGAPLAANLAHAVLDVGSGLGHWGRTLLPHLPSGGIIHGVDREARWVSKSAERAARDGLSDRFHYLLGSAEELPFADETFERKHSARVTIPLEICSRGISANAGFVKSRFTRQTRQRL